MRIALLSWSLSHQEECQQVLEDCQKSAKKMVLRELKKEKLIFTQDCTYLAEISKS